MNKIIVVFLLTVCCINCFGQRPVAPGKLSGANKAGNFEHIEGSYAAVNGITMYYEQYGEGETVLLIHENGGSVASFNSQINFFSKKFKVIVADSRAQGESDNDADSLSYELMTEDYYALLEKLDIDSAYIIGFDDGAVIGLEMAIYHPEKVKMLAIFSARLQSDSSSVLDASTDLLMVYKQMFTDSIKAGKKQYKSDLLLTNLSLHNPQIEPELLLNIEIPVLVMSGDKDFINLNHTLDIYKQLPHAQLSIFPDASHYFMHETPMLFNNSVMKFFTKTFQDRDVNDTLKFK